MLEQQRGWSRDTLSRAVASRTKTPAESWRDTCVNVGVDPARYDDLRKAVGRFKGGESVPPPEPAPAQPDEVPEATGEVEVHSTASGMEVSWAGGEAHADQIKTLSELLDAAKVDLGEWRVAKWIANKWGVGARGHDGSIVVTPIFQVKAWLEPRQEVVDARAVIADMVADARDHAPRYPARPAGAPSVVSSLGSSGETMLEVAIADLHVGKLAHAVESGQEYNHEIALKVFEAAVDRLVEMAGIYRPSRVLLPVGNDLLHVDTTPGGSGAATSSGTLMDASARWPVLFTAVRRTLVGITDALLSTGAEVDLLFVPGNHDAERSWMLGQVIDAWYRGASYVNVSCDPSPRHYYSWGDVLLGFAHGHNERQQNLPLIMATEAPRLWAESKWREWHLGHTHAKEERHLTVVREDRGVRTRVIPSLTAPDAWHHAKGYSAQQCAEAYVWGKRAGFGGMFSVSYDTLT